MFNLGIRGFSAGFLHPGSLPAGRNDTQCTSRCQMSLQSHCAVTTPVRNSNRTSIRARTGPGRRYKESTALNRQVDKMPFCTVVEKCNGVVVGAELACSIREENKAQRESYTADWTSISVKSRPEDRQAMMMNDDSRRETLARQWWCRSLIQTCPSGVFRVGTLESGVMEHQLLPKRSSLPLPIFTPAELGVRLGRGEPHAEEDLQPFQPADGICPTKRTVDEITKDLPPLKPTLMEFAKAPKFLGRSMSQEAQRG
ncbi:telethonin [Synchiropus splendidus]|uniref:telethonin n=1 Tax=Synchiropus splendidus TaxID=270530 RepID=UPI00237E085C|nr:telethonin [Synchiropus splendidus]